MQNGGLARKHTQLFKMSLGSCIKDTPRSGTHRKFQDSENTENQHPFVCVIVGITTQEQQQKRGPYEKLLCIIYVFIFRFQLFSVGTELKPYIVTYLAHEKSSGINQHLMQQPSARDNPRNASGLHSLTKCLGHI